MRTLTKFETLVPLTYEQMRAALAANVKPGAKILDLGPYEGNFEDYFDGLGVHYAIDAVDVDEKALEVLAAKQFKNISVNIVHQDGNEYLKQYEEQVDVVLSSASIHELNDPSNQARYLDWFFGRINDVLVPGGKAIIGDLYFPDHVSDEDVEAFRLYQLAAINHASARREFVKPELIDAAAAKHGFRLVSKIEIRAVKEIDRRYYIIVVEKP